MIRRMVLNSGENVSYIEDIFQEGLYAILVKLDQPDFNINYKFKTYFYAICLRHVNLLKRKKIPEENYFKRRLADDDDHNITNDLDNELIDKAFKDAFDELGNMCKIILKLYWREINLKEIADIISVDYSKVRKRKRECENALSAKIKSNPSVRCILETEAISANV